MNEEQKYEIIKRLVEENGNKKRAAMKMGLSIRQVNLLSERIINRRKSILCPWKQRAQAGKYTMQRHKTACRRSI